MPQMGISTTPVRFWDRDQSWPIFFFALALRLTVFLLILIRFGDTGFILPPFSDGYGYVTIAENLLEGNGFSRDEHAPFTPDTKRVPVYPLFLAATFTLTNGGWWLAALLQCALSAVTVFLVYRVTDSFMGRRAAFFAGILASTHPFAIFLSTQLLAETLFTLSVFIAFAFFIRALTVSRYQSLIASAITLGFATLVKPAGQYIPFLLLPFIAINANGARRISYPLVFTLCFILAASPWLIRNESVIGKPAISYEANILFDLHIAGYRAFKETGAAANASKYRTVPDEASLIETSGTELVSRLISIAAADPIVFTKYLVLTAVPFVLGDGFITMTHSLSPEGAVPAWDFSTSATALGRSIGFGILPPHLLILSIASKASWGAVLVTALLGSVVLVHAGGTRRLIAISIVVVIAYFMVAGGPVQSARYRAPVEPLIFLLAGIGIANLTQATILVRNRRKLLSREF